MPAAAPDLPATEIAIVEMTNTFRRKNNLGEVKRSADLARAARAYAEFMASSKTFSHTADGRQPGERVRAMGYDYCLVGENLASNLDTRGFATRQLATGAIEGWINSPGHRATMLAAGMTEIGVGIAKARGEERYLIVQLFARPQSLSVSFQVSNTTREPVVYALGGKSHTLEPSYAASHKHCEASTLSFERAGRRGIAGRYEARDGDVFVLKPLAGGGITVEVRQKEQAPK